MENQIVKFPPPPRLISAFTAGFDAIANRIALIALPALVDLFLWLGPHLRLKDFSQAWWDLSRSSPFFKTPDGAEMAAVEQSMTDFFTRFNLFSGLRTFPVGPSSLMSSGMPIETPLGAPIFFQPVSLFTAFGWGLLILLAGWFIGALYFRSVSGVALSQPPRPLGDSILQAFKLSVFWLLALVIFGLPALFLFTLVSLISPALAQGALILAGMVSLWLVLPVYFSPHGIFASQQDAFSAVRSSLRMIRYTLPTSGLFLFGVIIISQGLDFLWRTPPEASWWILVGIAGHAFISTALLAASFVYYRDVNVWLNTVLEQMKQQQQPVSAKV
ncbi:MAG: hypothetical protein FD146_1548 [Anaerolineaceae bacterium]|nr:MAG: hypothetical protein FD146_1548 [Anaerolineaceae bacterium]